MSPLVFLTPVWFVLEIAQLIAGERLLGVKQIVAGEDPRDTAPSEPVSFLWSACTLLYWLWLVAMLFQPLGQVQIVAMIVFTIAGYSIRRSCGLRWVLVVLTFEGALRIGMLISLAALAWRHF
jgi:hypothetical protein